MIRRMIQRYVVVAVENPDCLSAKASESLTQDFGTDCSLMACIYLAIYRMGLVS